MKQFLNVVLCASMLLGSQLALAQSEAANDAILSYTVDEVVQRYPADSIQSPETAESALKDVEEARKQLEARFATEQKLCYPKFFTTSCLNKAAERKRVDLLAVKAIEIEANSYIRHARVEKRDRKLEEKAKERAEKNAVNPILVEPKADEAAPRDDAADTDSQRKAKAAAYAEKQKEYAQRQQDQALKEKSEEAERAANVKKYEAKQKESAERQRKVAERKAEKERLEAAKNAKAGKDAPSNVVPGE